jgi:integrase
MATSLMVEAGVSVRPAQEILGHASERTTLSIYRHTLRRQHDDTAELIAVKAGLAAAPRSAGSNWKQLADK